MISILCLRNGLKKAPWLGYAVAKNIMICNMVICGGLLTEMGEAMRLSAIAEMLYINPQKELIVAVSGYFKPPVFDRIDFIKEQIEVKLKH